MAKSPFSYANFRWYFVLTWLLLAFAYACMVRSCSFFNWQFSVYESVVTHLVLSPAYAICLLLPAFYMPTNVKYVYALMVSIVLAYAGAWLSQKLLEYFVYPGNVQPNLFVIRWAMGSIVLFGLFFSGILWNRTEEREDAHKRQVEINEKLREAELHKLQHQLQPHFLFNSLNSINALVLIDAGQARNMVQKLSDFLRITLKRADEQWVNLENEVEYLNLYLDIEKVRFRHRLNLEMEITEEAKKVLLPTLILQPIVENAIKFGLYGTTGNVTISIHAGVHNNQLVVKVTNPFDAEMLPASGGTGFGLKAIRRRLQLLYNRNDLLHTTATAENIFMTNLTIPDKK